MSEKQSPQISDQPPLEEVSTPSRSEYRIATDAKQSQINRELKEIQPEIDSINLMLAALYEDESRQDELQSFAASAIEYLNKNCELENNAVTVSGHWYIPEISLSGGRGEVTFKATQSREEVLDTAVSIGFTIGALPSNNKDDEDQPPKVVLAFKINPARGIKTMTGIINYQPVALADIDEVSLTYVRESSSEIVSGNTEEIYTAIRDSNTILLELINDESLGFYDLELEDQQKLFQEIIIDAESKLPDSRAGDILIVDSLEISKMFIAETNEAGKTDLSMIKDQDDQSIPLVGSIIGFCIPEEITNRGQVRYSSPEELSITQQGLGIIVQPWPDSTGYLPDEYKDQDVIVPYGNIKDFDIQVL